MPECKKPQPENDCVNDAEEDVTDAPIDGSAYLRHYAISYEEIEQMNRSVSNSFVDPHVGWYKSTSCRAKFPLIGSKNPVELELSPHDASIYRLIDNYEDILCCRQYPGNETLRLCFCAHALNHILRSRKLIVKNNVKEKKFGLSDSLRDQSFHRARTLILSPTKESARRIVHTLLRLMPKGSTVSHKRRFERDFGPQEGETDEEKRRGKKPKDYEDWFSCNSSDHFRLGISFLKKSVKLYSAFVDSDLILASPLGLQTIIDDNDNQDTIADVQYITASTELLIVDQAEMLLMQNWANVQHIVRLLNQRPMKPGFASAGRIRLAYLAGYGRRYRQNLIFSAVTAPLISLLAGDCDNFQGFNYIPPLPTCSGLHSPPISDSPWPASGSESSSQLSDARTTATVLLPKLTLIAFAVDRGQTSNPFLSVSPPLSDAEDVDEGIGAEAVADVAPVVKKFKADVDDGSVLVGRRSLSHLDYTYLSGRALPLARLNTFRHRILPRLRRGLDSRVLIYVTDFYDLEELRCVLRAESLDFCCVHEYTEDQEAERFRTLFADGRIRILLLSERYYFFRRRRIRGANTFIFYGPPTFPWFVKELLQNASSPQENTSFTHTAAAEQQQVMFLYHPPLEAVQVTMITGKLDM